MAAKGIGERRQGRLEDEQLQAAATQLVWPHVSAADPLLKCLAVECLGRLAQAVYTPQVNTRTFSVYITLLLA